MVLEEKCCNCLNPISDCYCQVTFGDFFEGWEGYGLDPYGSSAYGAPTDVSPVIVRKAFTVLTGYEIKHYVDRGNPYKFNDIMEVYVYAANQEMQASDCFLSYKFKIEPIRKADLVALVTSTRQRNDLTAGINVLTPAFEYGKNITIEIEAKDFAGNLLPPFVFSFKIENE